MHIWIVQTGEPLPTDGPNVRGMRAMNLANALVERGHRVTIWSTNFYHQEKRHRFGNDRCIEITPNLTVRLIASIGYRRHVGPRRFVDHAQLGWRFPRLAKKCPVPDLAFIGFPPIEIAASAVRFCASRGVPTIVDVKDLWPDIFEDAVPRMARPVARLLLSPLRCSTRTALSRASGICATTDEYLSWATRQANRDRCSQDCVVPILPPPGLVDSRALFAAGTHWDALGVPEDGRLRACFVGNLGRTTDFSAVLEAIRSDPRCDRWQFVIAGSGDQEDRWRQAARDLPNVLLPGRITLPAIRSLFGRSTVGLAPFNQIANYESNIPNKIHDYLAAGLPVITPLGGPTRALLSEFGLNVRYDPHSPRSFGDSLDSFAAFRPDRLRLSVMHKSRFDGATMLNRLVDHLEGLTNSRAPALKGAC